MGRRRGGTWAPVAWRHGAPCTASFELRAVGWALRAVGSALQASAAASRLRPSDRLRRGFNPVLSRPTHSRRWLRP
ncbi:hypothetical protein BVI434_450132 [Burkholderia vietnamiensis]|nr:hypothetical protein BVI434_450132 [Burkholderia vietnamiensis]